MCSRGNVREHRPLNVHARISSHKKTHNFNRADAGLQTQTHVNVAHTDVDPSIRCHVETRVGGCATSGVKRVVLKWFEDAFSLCSRRHGQAVVVAIRSCCWCSSNKGIILEVPLCSTTSPSVLARHHPPKLHHKVARLAPLTGPCFGAHTQHRNCDAFQPTPRIGRLRFAVWCAATHEERARVLERRVQSRLAW